MKALLAAAMVALSAPAHAEFLTGARLLEAITSTDQSVVSTAVGYIAGVFDGTKGVLHCAPDPELRQLVAAVVAVLKASDGPALERSADQMFVPFLMKQFPCPRDGKQI